MMLLVSEIFRSVQGEGVHLGQPSTFLRLHGCDLACSWCDTAWTWDGSEQGDRRNIDEIADEIISMGSPNVVITGGEPLLQRRHLPILLRHLRAGGITRVEVETNGRHVPDDELVGLVDLFTVSPKLASSGNDPGRYSTAVLRTLNATGKAVFKFVVQPGEIDEVDRVVARIGQCSVFIMPEGTDNASLLAGLEALAPQVVERGWGLTTRLHIHAFGNQRGT